MGPAPKQRAVRSQEVIVVASLSTFVGLRLRSRSLVLALLAALLAGIFASGCGGEDLADPAAGSKPIADGRVVSPPPAAGGGEGDFVAAPDSPSADPDCLDGPVNPNANIGTIEPWGIQHPRPKRQ